MNSPNASSTTNMLGLHIHFPCMMQQQQPNGNSTVPPFNWPSWTVSHSEPLSGHLCCPVLIQPILVQWLFVPEAKQWEQAPGNRLLWIQSVKGCHKSKWNWFHDCPVVIQPHSHGSSVGSSLQLAFMKSSYQLVLCVSELFTLPHTRNLKRCSMDCSSLIVEQFTCPLLALQVSSLKCTNSVYPVENIT